MAKKKTRPQESEKTVSSWWFQPIWKICSSKWESSPSRGENKKYLKPPPRFFLKQSHFATSLQMFILTLFLGGCFLGSFEWNRKPPVACIKQQKTQSIEPRGILAVDWKMVGLNGCCSKYASFFVLIERGTLHSFFQERFKKQLPSVDLLAWSHPVEPVFFWEGNC